ncbi:MAG: tetratricopeptide repeat protein [Okeania sp. SIO2G4]|uniref:tetratricopeptide repeat protein n=1 Tax=unclassified Okeania TaxID=2634635 RepID=UPI0013B75AA3|nr:MULTISPECIES: tetratricopeptide repeat protein [unclassified Okeania]NEP42747.1 tetratricopeptide repeat protein [Okeania sp. SIO2H7]NEP74236.1 tetratricopeptide repeat protein [Okeania sp. SIO2G5]NEP95821.1 tetratricopeptide repeat protein [Okeania sp. SIO2F5]NEQ92681.1 tetratricopeptide repeat protein [Okeania sp. SIO2G4]
MLWLVYRDQDKYSEAEPLYQPALAIYEKAYGGDEGVRSQPTPRPSPSQEGISGVRREEERGV